MEYIFEDKKKFFRDLVTFNHYAQFSTFFKNSIGVLIETRKAVYEECAKLGVMVSTSLFCYYFNSDFLFSLWLHPPKNVPNNYPKLLLIERIKIVLKQIFLEDGKLSEIKTTLNNVTCSGHFGSMLFSTTVVLQF